MNQKNASMAGQDLRVHGVSLPTEDSKRHAQNALRASSADHGPQVVQAPASINERLPLAPAARGALPKIASATTRICNSDPLVDWFKRASLDDNEQMMLRGTPESALTRDNPMPHNVEEQLRREDALLRELFAHAASARARYDRREHRAPPA